jgi:hypothetical protein
MKGNFCTQECDRFVMDCGNKTAIAGGLDPRLLQEVGDLAFIKAICADARRLANAAALRYRKLDPKYLLFFYDERYSADIELQQKTTQEQIVNLNALPRWNNRVGNALFLAARVGASLSSSTLKCGRVHLALMLDGSRYWVSFVNPTY